MSRITVTVVYASPANQALREVVVDACSSVRRAIKASGLLDGFPEIDLSKNRVGIFGRLASLDTALQDGDQVEIYRPLAAGPNELRRRRAAAKAARSRQGT